MDEEGDDVADDEDAGQFGNWDLIDMCVVGGKDAKAETRNEKVVASANEKGGEYDE